MKEIYLIPGLGVDCRIFDFLELSSYSCHYLSWIDPIKDESIKDYVTRLSAQISSHNPILIGVSFGGIIAIELAKQIKTEKIILISSVRTKKEINWLIRLVLKIKIHRLAPASWLKKPRSLLFYLFGVKEQTEKKLLTDIILDTDPKFLRWALDSIADWKSEVIPKHVFLIHGSKDKLFPGNHGDVNIPGGGHFMIVSRAKEISDRLNQILD